MRRIRSGIVVALVVVGLFAVERIAAAEPAIVIESHVGARPDDAERFFSPVLDELAARGYGVGVHGVGTPYEEAVSKPAIGADKAMIHAFSSLVEEGQTAWYDARLDDAVKAMDRALEIAWGSPGALAEEETRRGVLLRALVVLAMAHSKLGHADLADETMAEVVRSFPDQPVSRSTFGPDAEKLHARVAKAIDATPRGTLQVQTERGAVVFVNEGFAGTGQVSVERPPGQYRVLVKQGDHAGRVYPAVVESGKTTIVEAPADFDVALHTSPVWAGLVFADEKARAKHEPAHSARLATALGVDTVVILRFAEVEGRRSVVGSVVSIATGQPERTASVAVEPEEPSLRRLQSLGAFLAGEIDALVEDSPGGGGSAGAGDDRTGGGLRWLRWPLLGAGIAAAGTGAYLITLDGNCVGQEYLDRTCPKLWETLEPGIGLAAVGVVAISGALWWHFSGGDERVPSAGLSIGPGGFGVQVRGAF